MTPECKTLIVCLFKRQREKKITSLAVFPLDICMFPKFFIPEGLHAKSSVTVIKQNQKTYFVIGDPRYIVNMLFHRRGFSLLMFVCLKSGVITYAVSLRGLKLTVEGAAQLEIYVLFAYRDGKANEPRKLQCQRHVLFRTTTHKS